MKGSARWLAVVALGLSLSAHAAERPLLALVPAAAGVGSWQTMGAPGATVALDMEGGAEPALRLAFTLPAPAGWAGAVVLPAPEAWGTAPGPAFALGAARVLRFRARGGEGGERIRVKVGIAGDQPFGDSTPLPFDSGWLTLSADWQTFAIPVDGGRLGRVVTPFVLIANRQHNPGGRPTVWLADIAFFGGE